MSQSPLFNQNFYGADGKSWPWIGQIADDSVWKDNIIPGKHESAKSIPGWGRRYKVRIMGIDDKEDSAIDSENLRWATIFYPVTAGGGQGAASVTSNLRQGMFVSGIFLDGAEQQIPVITGVFGHNAQIKLATKTGTDDSNYAPTSGFAEGRKTKTGSTKEIVPDSNQTVDGDAENAAIENADDIHQTNAADVKAQTQADVNTVLLKPDNIVAAAIKAIQTVLDNLVQKLNSYLSAISSYIDRVSNVISNVQKIINDAACQIAKYMKILFDKVMEYVMKQLNTALTNVVGALPTHMRAMFADMKEILTELILCLYGKMTGQLCGLIQGILDDTFNMNEAENKARNNANNPNNDDAIRRPVVQPCYSEDIIGKVFYSNKQEIEDANNNILDNVNKFLDDIQTELAGVSGALSDIKELVNSISGSMSAALGFTNLSLNIFGCELQPNVSVSDFYSLATGGSGQPDSEEANFKSIENRTNRETEAPLNQVKEVKYAEPPSTESDSKT